MPDGERTRDNVDDAAQMATNSSLANGHASVSSRARCVNDVVDDTCSLMFV
jgi:hypothetical protein